MNSEVLLIGASALVLSAAMTGAVRKIALLHGVLDIPNERSSHSNPTPRGGGASIVLVAGLGLLILTHLGRVHGGLVIALLAGGTAVAGIGFLDDRYSVPAGIRLAVHLGAAFFATVCVGGLPIVQAGDYLLHLGWFGQVLAVLGIVWALNLFNFMDGIDGIAGSEAVFILGAAGVLGAVGMGSDEVSAVGFVIGAACAGFLLWNWPPAKIFMGDVGSGYLGYVIGVLVLAASHRRPAEVWVWLTLGGVFFVDATVTLIRRIFRGEKVYQAHRSHAYQWLARRWRSHKRVTLSLMAVNLLWLLPCAFLASYSPGKAFWIALVSLAPLVVMAIWAGAGEREKN